MNKGFKCFKLAGLFGLFAATALFGWDKFEIRFYNGLEDPIEVGLDKNFVDDWMGSRGGIDALNYHDLYSLVVDKLAEQAVALEQDSFQISAVGEYFAPGSCWNEGVFMHLPDPDDREDERNYCKELLTADLENSEQLLSEEIKYVLLNGKIYLRVDLAM